MADGSRIVEVNNKLVLIGGTFEEPVIHNVLVINSTNETYAEIIKEIFFMIQKDISTIKSRMKISAELNKKCMEMNISKSTLQMIIDIKEDKKTQGKEQYYQTLSNLTDILNSSRTETEIVQKLNKEYPTK